MDTIWWHVKLCLWIS